MGAFSVSLRIRVLVGMLFIGIGVAYVLLLAPPLTFPTGTVVHINPGESAGTVAQRLKQQHSIASVNVFKILVKLYGDDQVQAGSYLLATRQSAWTLAARMTSGDTGLAPLRVTIPEGQRVRQIAALLTATLGDFDAVEFERLAAPLEGHLFPDTYFFLPGTPPLSVIATLRNTYEEHVAPLRADIAVSGHTELEIITMASLLQAEARTDDSMKLISGILWKRVRLGMPLQVDAVFGYIFNRDTYSPTFDDLKVESSYNTYTHKGLPPGPIGNPGMDAIRAALHPTASPYLYYLTGKDGTMHYAKTFDQHVQNRVYLK